MSTDNELFDSRIAEWLEDDPTTAPAQLMETVRAAIPLVTQRRRPFLPWRVAPTVRLVFGAAVVVLVVVAAGSVLNPFRQGAGGPPTPSPSATLGPTARPDQPPTTLTPFTSELYGYTIGYPTRWRVKPATRRLEPLEPPWAGSAPVDYFETDINQLGGGPSAGPIGQLIVASAEIGPDSTLDAWTDGTAHAVCGDPATTEQIELDGEPASLLTYSDGCYSFFHIWVTVVHATTGTHIVWLDDLGREAADRALFEDILATFSFPPDGQVTPTP